MKSCNILVLACCAGLVVGCGDKAPVPEKLPDNPKHLWSSQQESYKQAKEVARFVEEQQQLNEKRIQELGIVGQGRSPQ